MNDDTNIAAVAEHLIQQARESDRILEEMKKLGEMATTSDGLAEFERLYPAIRNILHKYDEHLGEVEKVIAARRKLLRLELRHIKATLDARRKVMRG